MFNARQGNSPPSQPTRLSSPTQAGKLIKSWKETIDSHEQANTIFVSAGTKRKAVCVLLRERIKSEHDMFNNLLRIGRFSGRNRNPREV